MDTYVVECLAPKGTLTAQGDTLILRSHEGLDHQVVPISALQGIRIKPPTALVRGSLFLDVLKSPVGSVSLGSGFSMNIGNGPIQCVYKKDQSEAAERLYQYVLSRLCAPADTAAPADSFVDELVKLKALLDQGALSQEEFDAAKKKLLEA